MIRFLKYELKRTRNYKLYLFLAIISILILLNLLYKHTSIGKTSSISIYFVTLMAIVFSINILYFTNRYRKDIFSKSSYLTFTINVSTTKIILSKIICGIITTFLTLILFTILFESLGLFINGNSFLTTWNIKFKLILLFVIILYWTMSYMIIIFGISLSRVKIFKRYYEFVTMVLSIVILTLVIWIMRNIYTSYPLVIDLNNFSLRMVNSINGIDISMLYLGAGNSILGINMIMVLISIFAIVFVFFANNYILEEKIDL